MPNVSIAVLRSADADADADANVVAALPDVSIAVLRSAGEEDGATKSSVTDYYFEGAEEIPTPVF